MTILGLTMVVSVNSDMMINGYYGNARASYYAADSGMNIARQYLVNQLKGAVSTHACLGWGAASSDTLCQGLPLDYSGAPTTALSNLKSAYSGFSSGQVNVGNASQSWPSSFVIKDTSICTNSFSGATPVPTYNNVNGLQLVTNYAYTFTYTLCSTGAGSAMQRSAVKESGTLLISVSVQDIPPPTFAGFGAFINNYNPCSQGFLVPGIFSGPTFTNGAWGLSNAGPYIFTDPVKQVSPQIDYSTGGGCIQSTASSYPGINVNFQQGLTLGAQAAKLPSNTYSQKWAAIDGMGCGETTGPSCSPSSPPTAAQIGNPPTNAQLNTYLKDVNGNAYPSTGTSSGVFLAYTPTGPTTGTLGTSTSTGTGNVPPAGYAGGIYVEGSAAVTLTPGTDSFQNPTQIYTIQQGSTITTITTDPANPPGVGSTTITSGGSTKTLTGIPSNLASSPGGHPAATLLYVDGTISALTGPPAVGGVTPPAIQNNAMITVAAAGDIDITGDIKYTVEPVTISVADSIVSATYNANATNVLGVFTSSGNIVLSSPYSNKNLEVDGSLAAVGGSASDNPPGQCNSSTCGFLVNGSINTFTNVGGQIQSNIFAANMATQNTYFDRRFSLWNNGSFAPPWFPGITNSGSYMPQVPKIGPSQQRTSWVWVAAQ
jgi:hypothetical protein